MQARGRMVGKVRPLVKRLSKVSTPRIAGKNATVVELQPRTESKVDEAVLRQVAESRSVVGQAMGILMERYDLTAERAFALLQRISSETETKLRIVAVHLIETRQLLTHGDPPPQD